MTDVPVFVERIDYEAAAREIGMIVRGVQKFGIRNKHAEVDSELEGHWAGRVVGAALVGIREANGQRVEWCEEHKDVKWKDSPGCHMRRTQNFPNECRIVSALLIDPPTEEESRDV